MKKNFNKIASLVLAASMMVAMPVSVASTTMVAYAAEQTTYTITIDQNDKDKGSHTYGAYQIFAGTLSADGKTLSDITWGSGVDSEKIKDFTFNDKSTAADIAKTLTSENAAAFAKAIQDYLSSTATGTALGTGDLSISGLSAGYYLLKDTSNPTGSYASETAFILQLVADQTVKPKSSVPEHNKKVDDINDSTGTEEKLQDSADYDIGDKVPYTLTTTLGDGMDNYKSYSVAINDKMSKGLTYNNDAKITIDDVDVTNNFTFNAGNKDSDGYTTYKWSCNDIKAISGATVKNGSKIIITYTATLNSDAVIGAAGNPNESWLEYDNNPNESGKGKPGGNTPHDKNIVFTYKVIVNKVKEDKTALAGAEFTLTKNLKNGTTKTIDTIHFVKGEDGKLVTVSDNTGKTATTFEFDGLDDGTYVLSETVVPDGYNKIDDQTFTVTADHDKESDDPILKSLSGDVTSGEITFTPNTTEGSLTSDVENRPGSALPTTGGMGTTILYVAGAILVIAGAAVLVIKKRHEA